MKNTEWNLKDIYKTEEDVKKDCNSILESSEKLKTFKGKLNTEKAILDFMTILEDLDMKLERVYALRYLKKDENILAEGPNKKIKEVLAMNQKISEEIVFFNNEFLENSQEFFDHMYEKEPGLLRYKIELDDLVKDKQYILSKDVEEALAAYGRIFGSFSDIYDTLIDGDLEFPDVVDSNGEKHKATNEKLSLYLYSKDRVLRKSAFESRYKAYGQFAHTISEMYLTNVRNAAVTAKLRKYPSYIWKKLDATDSNLNVYNSLIKAVNDNLNINHKYFALRKKLLGEEKMYHYDNFAPIIPNAEESNYSYEEAKQLVLKAVEPLGEKYVKDLTKAFESNWSDVYERDKKASGAYSLDVYGVHPYVLQNFNGTLNDVSTTAHEFGHAMHSYYSSAKQEYPVHRYTIMVAEVASTVNETLLMEYMIRNEKDKVKKASYIIDQLQTINSTLVRQTMFAEFEQWVHGEIGNGIELTCEDVSEYYLGLVKKYFGDSIEVNEELKYEWARIPHFYRPFYVYQYSTGIASAICIVSNILEKGEEYVPKYLEMLEMGGSIKPLDELRHAEVDLETDVPVKKAFEYFNRKIDELEKIVDEINSEK